MKVLITGATGTIGNAIGKMLASQGHEIVVISRNQAKAKLYLEFPAEIIEHDLVQFELPKTHWQGIDGVIHLMGESINGRWTSEKKKAVLDSRVFSSQNLLAQMPESVQVVLSASAQNIYESSLDKIYTEEDLIDDVASSQISFLKSVCYQWELPFKQKSFTFKNTRFAQMRIGLVHDAQSGILQKLIPVFQRGFGGHLSDGRQWMSWIALEDIASAFVFVLTQSTLSGPVNLSSPNAVQNKNWTYSLAQALGVFKNIGVPAFVLKTVLGEMSELALSSVHMKPHKLLQAGFKFKYESLTKYFEEELQDFKNLQSVFLAYQYIDAPIEKVFKFFAEAQNLEQITPPLLRFKIEKISEPSIQEGTEIDYSLKIHGVPVKWKTLISKWNPPNVFIDEQIKGPYQKWHHTHEFKSFGTGTLMRDRVIYKMPLGFLGYFASQTFVQKDVSSIFTFRREILKDVKFNL